MRQLYLLDERQLPSRKFSEKWAYGDWGPEDELIGRATASVENTFLQNAGMLMSSKSFSAGRENTAAMLRTKGAMWSTMMEDNPCDLCASLDGKEVAYPSEEYDALEQPAHCNCACTWIYIEDEESNWQPDTSMEDIRGLADLIEKHGHELPFFQDRKLKAENEALVSARAIDGLMSDALKDMVDDMEESDMGDEE